VTTLLCAAARDPLIPLRRAVAALPRQVGSPLLAF
jgi:hypothetical protein